uniref:Chaperonin GroEL n=1 Tax=Cyanidium sp. THAL103 TaxID=3027999 RepID=A0A9Y1I493_9RHOD|nr:chaperonin GroEL [Cyanidium sp. THAL103]
MSKKFILHKDKARFTLKKGIDKLSKAVGVTLGPKGRNVVLGKIYGLPQIINDGATIAKEIELQDHIENIGAHLIKQAALKTNDIAGDGTTTSTILAHSILTEGLKYISIGVNAIDLRRGIQKAESFILNEIRSLSRPVKYLNSINDIASISSGNNNDIGLIIAQAINIVGKDGILSLEENNLPYTELKIIQGIKFDKGYISPYFIENNKTREIILENPLIIIINKQIKSVKEELLPILTHTRKLNKPLLIIVEDISTEILSTLILNKLKGVVNVVAVRTPGLGNNKKDFLEDLATVVGSRIIIKDMNLNNAFGKAKKVIISQNSTTIITDKISKSKIKFRCEEIRNQILISNSDIDKQHLKERLAKLNGTIAIIKVGASTEIEMKESKLRFEDAINASKAAISEGIIPGGGSALAHISDKLKNWMDLNLKGNEFLGALIIKKSLISPFKKIIENSGKNPNLIFEIFKNKGDEIGYDSLTDSFVNMYDAGIIDATKVIRLALQNAIAIASIIITTDCVIIDAL